MLKPRKPVPSLEFETPYRGGHDATSVGVEKPALFARPHFEEIAQAIDFVVGKNYAPRGEA